MSCSVFDFQSCADSFSSQLIYRTGWDGFNLYYEIHTNWYNQLIHGFTMMVVAGCTFTGLPALFGLSTYPARMMQIGIFASYLMYFASFDWIGAVWAFCIYFPILAFTQCKTYNREQRVNNVFYNLIVGLSTVGLTELIAHTFIEEKNSNLWELPNSIAISPLFGVRSLMHCLLDYPLYYQAPPEVVPWELRY